MGAAGMNDLAQVADDAERPSEVSPRGERIRTPLDDLSVPTDLKAGFVCEMASKWHVPRGDEEALVTRPG